MGADQMANIFMLLAGILHLGNVSFVSAAGAQIAEKSRCACVCVCVCVCVRACVYLAAGGVHVCAMQAVCARGGVSNGSSEHQWGCKRCSER